MADGDTDSSLPDMRRRDVPGLAEVFRYFGEVETPRLGSPVYTAYSLGVAEDEAILALAAEADVSQPAPNVLYASVKDCLLEDSERSDEARALSRFYPTISSAPIPDESPWPAFRRFCLAHSEDLLPRIRAGRTQTCVVHRCTAVLPALASLPRVRAAGERVSLLEIGPSAGLNLRLDRYRYAYLDEAGKESAVWGAESARPVLECGVRGGVVPPMPGSLEVVARQGLDLNPLDLSDARELRWLRALVWPEHLERNRIMEEALAAAEGVPLDIVAGDATRVIEAEVRRLPQEAPRVVFATHVFYQIPPEGIRAIHEGLAAASGEAPVDLIVMESSGEGDSKIEWFAFADGARTGREVLARSDSHGRWLEWGAV